MLRCEHRDLCSDIHISTSRNTCLVEIYILVLLGINTSVRYTSRNIHSVQTYILVASRKTYVELWTQRSLFRHTHQHLREHTSWGGIHISASRNTHTVLRYTHQYFQEHTHSVQTYRWWDIHSRLPGTCTLLRYAYQCFVKYSIHVWSSHTLCWDQFQ